MSINNSAADAFDRMDAMYRHQRYFYDFTRRYYLLGRDGLLARMNVQPRENILEIGCGTGRNLIKLARKYPSANFFGLDASGAMLKTACGAIDAENLRNIRLRTALADDFDFQTTFNLNEPFDAIFFSYSISMISTWKESLAVALENLKSGGKLYIVDFYDQMDLPAWFRRLLQSWLKQFRVRFWNGLLPHLEELAEHSDGKLTICPIARRYAFIAEFEKNSAAFSALPSV